MDSKIVSKAMEKISSLKMNKKGIYAVDLLTEAAIGIMVLALFVVVVLIILGQMQSNPTLAPTNGTAYNALGSTSTAIATIPTWFTIFITVVVAVGLIALVLVFRQLRAGRN